MARGKGKKRGGMSRFAAQSAEEIEERNRRLADFDAQRNARRAEAGCSDAEDEEEDGEEAAQQREAMLVGQRVAQVSIVEDKEEEGSNKKNRSALDGLIEVSNPNFEPVKQMKIKDLGTANDPSQMTRKEREAAEKEAAAAAYRKRHEMGLTEEYKKDMEKLAQVRKRREEAAAKLEAEKAVVDAIEDERRKKALAAGALNVSDDEDDDEGNNKNSKKKKDKGEKGGIPKLDKIAIKKMKPALLKEALKLRELDIQGTAKELIQRLVDYEENRSDPNQRKK